MTAEELLARTDEYKLIVHHSDVFFQTRLDDVAAKWTRLGARVRPWYTEGQILNALRCGDELPQGYEVHLLPLLQAEWVTVDGDDTNVAPERFRELVREMAA